VRLEISDIRRLRQFLDLFGPEVPRAGMTDMVREGTASRDRAGELAAMVLRENGASCLR
jgi:hypothetical protein